MCHDPAVKKWAPLTILAAAQFVMVLDQAVMNVSISQLVDDFDTSVTAIQAVITLYSLVMAMFMLTGGKIGDIFGRRRAFVIGLVIYGIGSGLTAIAPTVGVLAFGWSILEGVGAALVLPALAALIAGNYQGGDRAVAYSVIGGVAGAGIAVGPIVGGWATTELSWRIVFAGEVVLVLAILATSRLLSDAARPGRAPRLDVIGASLSASGLGLVVLGVLQGSNWGWVRPKHSPVEPFGFSATPFVIALGGLLLWAFVAWQHHCEATDRDPLVHLALFRVAALKSGVQTFLSQNLILMGIFFTIPLYLQLVLGFDALETGLRMLPVSVAMFVTSAAGSWLSHRVRIRTIVRAGLVIGAASAFGLVASVDPQLNSTAFGISMALLGVGMGLIASQLGNVVQSSVDESGRSEAGGLQYTAQQLGSALGVALIGAIVITGLVNTFVDDVSSDDRISKQTAEQVSIEVNTGASFVAADDVEDAAEAADLPPDEVDAIVDHYEDAQIESLKAGLLVAALIALASLGFTKGLPARRAGEPPSGPADTHDSAVAA